MITTEPKTKHTPGPWKAEVNPNSLDMEVASENNNTICVVDGDDEANAKLIAAAPELLEQLIEAKNIIRNWHGMGMRGEEEKTMWEIYDNKSPEMKRINDVIKKAIQ